MVTAKDLNSIAKAINNAKKELFETAKNEGLVENFGQNIVREFYDKYEGWQYGTKGQRVVHELIEQLEVWCMNLTLQDIK